MGRLKGSAKSAWIDNYLDLYNYAGSIKDTKWQEEIQCKLQEILSLPEEEFLVIAPQPTQIKPQPVEPSALWQQFNLLSTRILELYALFQETPAVLKPTVLKEIWELKMLRLEITKSIIKWNLQSS